MLLIVEVHGINDTLYLFPVTTMMGLYSGEACFFSEQLNFHASWWLNIFWLEVDLIYKITNMNW
jgi:hypothetical protein